MAMIIRRPTSAFTDLWMFVTVITAVVVAVAQPVLTDTATPTSGTRHTARTAGQWMERGCTTPHRTSHQFTLLVIFVIIILFSLVVKKNINLHK